MGDKHFEDHTADDTTASKSDNNPVTWNRTLLEGNCLLFSNDGTVPRTELNVDNTKIISLQKWPLIYWQFSIVFSWLITGHCILRVNGGPSQIKKESKSIYYLIWGVWPLSSCILLHTRWNWGQYLQENSFHSAFFLCFRQIFLIFINFASIVL